MQTGYFHRVAALTPTKMWINNVTQQEAELAIEAGAMGCTQNPSYTWKMLNHADYKDYALSLLRETLKETDDDNEVECILQRKLVADVGKKFLTVYNATQGDHGYVSIQGDPIHEENPQVIIDEGRKNREMGPNIMIKIPATEAGIEAMETLLAENTPINATEIMSVSQVVDVCELIQKSRKKYNVNPPICISLITGIYDEWLQKDVEKLGIDISPDILYQAGMVVAKKVYRIIHDRNYNVGLIGGGVRGLQHFTEMVGGDVCITMNWSGTADKLIEMDLPVVSRLFNPVQDVVLDILLEKVPGFRKAFMENGLTIKEYEEFGPVKYFRDMFISSWRKSIELIKRERAQK